MQTISLTRFDGSKVIYLNFIYFIYDYFSYFLSLMSNLSTLIELCEKKIKHIKSSLQGMKRNPLDCTRARYAFIM